MMYDISVKNSNNIELFRGQNFTEELTKLVLERYAHYPNVSIWKTPETNDCSDCVWKQTTQKDLDESEESE